MYIFTTTPDCCTCQASCPKYMKEIVNLGEYFYFYPTIEELNLK
jgi:hypothetical protein